MTFWTEQRVLVTGGTGFLGRHVVAALEDAGASVFAPRHQRHNLVRQMDAAMLFENGNFHNPRYSMVIHLAAAVGGIGANMAEPGRFLYENAVMGLNVMEYARRAGVQKFVTIGTACSYPKDAPLPLHEQSLFSGPPEPTNAPYGLAKRLIIAQGQAYRKQYGMDCIAVIPANLYGPGDNFDPQTSHVIPAIIRKVADAQARGEDSVTLWGDGTPTRDFLYVEDAAAGILAAAEKYSDEPPINLGRGQQFSIGAIADMIAALMEYRGEIVWDLSKPNGQPHRMMDVTRAKWLLDWESTFPLYEGLRRTIDWYRETA